MLLQHLSQFSCFYKRCNNEMATHLVSCVCFSNVVREANRRVGVWSDPYCQTTLVYSRRDLKMLARTLSWTDVSQVIRVSSCMLMDVLQFNLLTRVAAHFGFCLEFSKQSFRVMTKRGSIITMQILGNGRHKM
jgi:hypothetical protein